MNVYLTDPSKGYLAWILVIVTFALAIYILTIDWKHFSNRLVCLLLVIFGVNQAAEGLFNASRRRYSSLFSKRPGRHYNTHDFSFDGGRNLRLLKPEWLNEHRKWAEISQWSMVVLAVLPGILILLDILIATQRVLGFSLLYSGLNPETYAGGFILFTKYTQGLFAPVLVGINLFTLLIILLVFCLYVAIIDRKSSRSEKLLAGIIFAVIGISGGLLIAFRAILFSVLGFLASNTLIALLYSYAYFHQMALEHRLQRGNLQLRLTLLVLSIAVSVQIGVVLTITSLRAIPQISLIVSLAGLLLLSALIWLTVRQALHPLHTLIKTASAITEGN